MHVPTNLLALIFVLSFLIFFHEGGHFLVAKAFRFPVEVFSLGFGKRLFGFRRKETDYRVSLIPLGGYVKVVGLGPDESDVVDGKARAAAPIESPRWQRFLILLAGPAVNLVLAVLLTAGALVLGLDVPRHFEERPVVKHIDPGSPADKAGVRVEDEIVKVLGKTVTTWKEVELELGVRPREEIDVDLRRDGKPMSVKLTPDPRTKYDIGYTGLNPYIAALVDTVKAGYPFEAAGILPGDKVVAIGGKPVDGYYEVVRRIREEANGFGTTGPKAIAFEVERAGRRMTFPVTPRAEGATWRVGFTPRFEVNRKRVPVAAAIPAAFRECLAQTRTTFETVARLVRGSGSMRQLSGPIDIAKFSGDAVRTGLSKLLELMGILSLQLGILNLLPIPLLDGGQLFVLVLEGIVRRDFSLAVKERLLQAGFVFLVLLMGTVLVLDVVKNI